LCGAKDFV
jgi:ribonuclease HI